MLRINFGVDVRYCSIYRTSPIETSYSRQGNEQAGFTSTIQFDLLSWEAVSGMKQYLSNSCFKQECFHFDRFIVAIRLLHQVQNGMLNKNTMSFYKVHLFIIDYYTPSKKHWVW